MYRLKTNDPFSDPFLRKITIKGLFFSEKGQKKGHFFSRCIIDPVFLSVYKIDQLPLGYRFYGKDVSGMYFFMIFVSCELF